MMRVKGTIVLSLAITLSLLVFLLQVLANAFVLKHHNILFTNLDNMISNKIWNNLELSSTLRSAYDAQILLPLIVYSTSCFLRK